MFEMHNIEPYLLIPFAIMLLSIAILPLALPRFWGKNSNKLLFVLLVSVPTAIMLSRAGLGENLEHQMLYDYVPFIVLLMALYVVTGGIRINYTTTPRPTVNAAIMFIGYGLASIVGTTGAAMLLIRPLLEINRDRTYKVHTILFFIAMVANCGGVLTPLGDPPLFLLYLRGAEFSWFQTLFPQWVFVGSVLLFVYVIIDTYIWKRKELMGVRPRSESEEDEPIKISFSGSVNLFYLSAILLSVAFINPSQIPAMAADDAAWYMRFLREIVLILIIILSLISTRRRVRRENHFSWEPITEVAILFVGIFVTMTPALLFLNDNAASLGITEPSQFFFASGALSSFLDNAPTAVAFHSVAQALPVTEGTQLVAGISNQLLTAIALGSVLFGAMTYIGNGPNFMVKAVAENDGVRMPSFFGYIFKFSLIILLPTYILMALVFFSR
ncbi:MAG: sodium:proton antiporter [Alistipes sp.]|nr:sodium:proton antiporter [Alistipes sp.]